MQDSACRPYRRHLILQTRVPLFGLRRYEVWDGGTRVGVFRDVVSAERHIDSRLGG
ncbi:MAG: hypothetical protein ACO1OD_09610 [Croceibacterium sp.]